MHQEGGRKASAPIFLLADVSVAIHAAAEGILSRCVEDGVRSRTMARSI